MSRERHVITGSPMILSFANNGVRSSGDILVSGVPTSPFYQYSTSIVDQANFNAYTDLAVANTGLLGTSAAISLDGLFVGYSTYYNYGGHLPHFEQPSGDFVGPNVSSLNPFNPSNKFGTGRKNTGLVDSGTFTTNVWVSGGHSITSALIYDNYATTGSINANVHPISNHFDADFYIRKKTELNDIRSIAHRLPMIAAGWSYDINNRPTPIQGTGLHPEALWNSSLWKVGPIDLRWDEYRKNYTTEGVHMGFCAEDFAPPANVLSPEEGYVYTYDPNSRFSSSGEIVNKVLCKLYDTSAGPIDSGTLVYYRYCNGDFHIIYSACDVDTSIQPLINIFNAL